MRLCLFTPTFLPLVGGAEHNADLLARGFQSRGHQVHVLAQSPKKSFTEPTLPYPVSRFPHLPLQHLWPQHIGHWLKKLHRSFPFDVCLAFYSYPCGYVAGRLKNQLRFKLAISPRGGDLHDEFHLRNKFRINSIIAQGYRSADHLIPISQWLVQRLHETSGPALPPTTVVYNGIDIDQLHRDMTAADAQIKPLLDSPFILHLSRFVPLKNQMLAVEAIHQCADIFRGKHDGIFRGYAFVGDGRTRPEVEARAQQLGLTDIIHFLGIRQGLEKAWLLKNATFMVSTSQREALGTILIEALGAGLPMLATDIPAHRELIADAAGGLKGWARLFKSNDAPDLATHLRHMLTTNLTPLRQSAIALRPQYTLTAMLDAYENICQSLLP